jgi:ribosomal-protein-alanine N-acetyltransferase
VALEENTLAGYLGVQFGPDGGDIMTIATDPGFRGRGVGKRLLKTMVQKLQEKNLQWLTLEVRPSNAPALKLYESFGFRQVGRRPNYYKNPREDALLLTKFFEEGPESC